MLGLQLRDEFKGARLRGTTIDFNNDAKTGALDMEAKDFLAITYPSIDLIKSIKAVAPGSNKAVVMVGNRGQGKSHLMAAVCHIFSDPEAGEAWLKAWSDRIGQPELASLSLQSKLHVIAEPLHEHRFAYLWDILFARHPNGEFARGKWQGRKTDVPGKDILIEMFKEQPTALLLDEFQTWFDGLSDANEPRQVWAFNFIQILSEIAENNPELLSLVVSVREGNSNAAQQLFRVNPVRVDFKGQQAQHDRRKLLLYRIFENRVNIPASQIEPLVAAHVSEFMRLSSKPGSELERHKARFIESWPYSPELLQLLDDEVIFAVQAQGTRDLVRILVELFKASGDKVPVITSADFDLSGDDRGSAASLIDTVGIEHHKQLRDKALRNLTAVQEALGGDLSQVPHLREIISALWLRSLSLDNHRVGAEPETLQIDVTRGSKVDDNSFQAELGTIENNSYNIHKVGSRLVFKLEENARTRLLAHARNDKLFQNGEDVDYLVTEIRHIIGGDAQLSGMYRTIVLKREWNNSPWEELDERDRPQSWDARIIPIIVLPTSPDPMDASLGQWVKKFLVSGRNAPRFLLPRKAVQGTIYQDRELMILARAAFLAKDWAKTEAAYRALATEFNGHIKTKVADRFDRFAILRTWNSEDASKCVFDVESHGSKAEKIPVAMQEKIKQNLFIAEEFDDMVVSFAQRSMSLAKLLAELREPRGGKECIPWMGEAAAKDAVLAVCADGRVAINVRGLRSLQRVPGEDAEIALRRMKRDFDVAGKQLEDTLLTLPGTPPQSSGQPGNGEQPQSSTPLLPGVPGLPAQSEQSPTNPFGEPPAPGAGGGMEPALSNTTTKLSANPTSGLNLLSRVADTWRIQPGTTVRNVSLRIDKLTGAQLQQLIRTLPDGLSYGLDAEKEEN